MCVCGREGGKGKKQHQLTEETERNKQNRERLLFHGTIIPRPSGSASLASLDTESNQKTDLAFPSTLIDSHLCANKVK